jgi:retron-type reverse transcriptase
LHRAIVKIIEPIFEKSFIHDSYSSRKEKGAHKAIKRLKYFAWRLSQNDTKIVWALKCDIKKFFDSVDHCILIEIINKKIIDKKTMSLIEKIILSFHGEWGKNKGIPLGNLTSQLFANIYLDKADQFIKRELRVKYYIRYCDDFVILSCNRRYLNRLIFKIKEFLEIKLNIRLHPKKIFIKRWHQGVDFLGFVIFPHHIVLRTKTKKRILKNIRKRKMELMCGKISEEIFKQILQSYLSIFLYCRSWSIRQEIIKVYRK